MEGSTSTETDMPEIAVTSVAGSTITTMTTGVTHSHQEVAIQPSSIFDVDADNSLVSHTESKDIQLFTSLQGATSSVAASREESDDEDLSSTDTAVISPIFDSSNPKSSSDGSMTEDEKDAKEELQNATKKDIIHSPTLEKAQSEEGPAEAASTVRPLTTKRSLWNLIRGASTSMTSTVPLKDATTIGQNKVVEEKKEQRPIPANGTSNNTLTKTRSFAQFSSIDWNKSLRRHTLTAFEGGSNFAANLGEDRSLDGSVPLPRANVDEVKVAEEAIRFADARHIIKTENNVEMIRDLADRLEQGWREKQQELGMMRTRWEESKLQLYDIRDENKQLRSQLAGLSEQIVARDHDFEELQKMAVEQSKKERVIWEEEKRQAVEIVEHQLKQLQDLIRQGKQKSLSYDESDDEEGELFSAVTSATTSIGGELQSQQAKASFLSVQCTTPTTPTSHGASKWKTHFSSI